MIFKLEKENWYKSGIYKISTTKNEKFYIGSAKNFYYRAASHKSSLIKGKHPSPQLQMFVNKYGVVSLIFEIIEIVDDLNKLTEREQYYLDTLNPFGINGYNTNPIANSMLGYKHKPETLEKFKFRNPTILNDEARRKISESKIGKKRDEKTRLMLLERSQKRRKFVLQFDLNGKFIQEFNHTREAARILNINRSNIIQSCKYKVKIIKGFIFLFKGDENIIDNEIKKDELKRRLSNDCKREILDTKTNIRYKSLTEAAKSIGLSPTTLCLKLKGKTKNNTTLIYL